MVVEEHNGNTMIFKQKPVPIMTGWWLTYSSEKYESHWVPDYPNILYYEK